MSTTQNFTIAKSLAAANIAAMASGVVTHPIDLVKVRMQLAAPAVCKSGDVVRLAVGRQVSVDATPGVFRTGMNVIQAEGVAGIYQGLSASLIRQAMFIGTKFAAYDILKKAIASDGTGESLNFAEKVACGLGAGLIGAIVGTPADLAMVRMQADGRLPVHLRRNYSHGGQALVHIARTEGVTTLWRGCAPTINRAMIVTASQMAIYDQAKQWIKANAGLEEGLPLHSTASLAAGIVAAITSNPFDVAKTRLMNMSPDKAGKLPYSGTFDCMIKSVRADGVGSLYRGLKATIIRQVPLNIVRFTAMEQLKVLLKL